ncbi:unnamed protein product [Agarophyton chilense]
MTKPSTDNGNNLPDDLHSRHLLAIRLAREAGDVIFSLRFGNSNNARGTHDSFSLFTKTDASDLVTTADHASQEHIFSGLRNAYPHHRLIGEETKESHAPLNDKPTWIVDAIDGTTNYVHGIPHFAVCIAHARDKRVELGVVYNPFFREMFHGVRGKGSFMNGKRMNCASTTKIKEALILSEWGYVRDEGAKSMLAANERLLVAGVRGVRQLGSGALDICYVGMGMADGVYCGVEDGKRDSWHIWDYAAASVIAEEAGATMRTVDGGEFHVEADSMVCSTPGLMNVLLEVLKESEGAQARLPPEPPAPPRALRPSRFRIRIEPRPSQVRANRMSACPPTDEFAERSPVTSPGTHVHGKWSIVVAASVVHALHAAAVYMVPSTLLSPMRHTLNLTVAEITRPLIAYRIVQTLFLLPAGLLLDAIGPQLCLRIAMTAAALSAPLLPLATSLNQLILLQIFFALTKLFGGLSAMLLIVTSAFPGENGIGTATSVLLSGYSFAGFLAPAVIGSLSQRLGWRFAIGPLADRFNKSILMTIFGTISAVSCFLLLDFSLFTFTTTTSLLKVVAFVFFYAVGYAAVFSLTTSVLPEFGKQKLGFRSNFNLMVLFASGSLGSYLSAALRSTSGTYKWAFVWNGISWLFVVFSALAKYILCDRPKTRSGVNSVDHPMPQKPSGH